MDEVGVAIVSLGRCPPLLAHLCRRWEALGAQVSLVGSEDTLAAVRAEGVSENLVTTAFNPTPQLHGDAIALAFEAVGRPFVLLQADDTLPVGDWSDFRPRRGAITGVRLVDMGGQRHFDWAAHVNGLSYLLPYGEPHSGAYITGAAQLWSPEARDLVSYRGRPFRTSGDVRVCWDARRAGIELVSPADDTPLVVHLDRMDRQLPWATPEVNTDVEF